MTTATNAQDLLSQLRICERYLDSKSARKDNSGHRQFVESCIHALDFAALSGNDDIVQKVDEASKYLRTSILLDVLSEVTRGAGKDINQYHPYSND